MRCPKNSAPARTYHPQKQQGWVSTKKTIGPLDEQLEAALKQVHGGRRLAQASSARGYHHINALRKAQSGALFRAAFLASMNSHEIGNSSAPPHSKRRGHLLTRCFHYHSTRTCCESKPFPYAIGEYVPGLWRQEWPAPSGAPARVVFSKRFDHVRHQLRKERHRQHGLEGS